MNTPDPLADYQPDVYSDGWINNLAAPAPMEPAEPAPALQQVEPASPYKISPIEDIGKTVWRDRLIDLKKNYPEPAFLLEFNGMKFFTIGDVVVIKGKPKKGKSHLMLVFIIALLTGSFIGINTSGVRVKKILYIDAEMQPNYTAALARKVHRLAGINPHENSDQFFVLNLKMDSPEERERLIEDTIRDLQPDLVFIDGVKDITRTEPNDQAEGKRIGEMLKKWTATYECMIMVAIHENKNDQNSRGAVGAAVEEICSEVWRIDRADDIFTASQTAFRYHSPIENLCFRMDEFGNMEPAEGKTKISPDEAKFAKTRFAFAEIFTHTEKLNFNALQDEYMRVKRVKQTAAYNAIMYAMDAQIIIKNLAGMYEISNLTSPHISQ